MVYILLGENKLTVQTRITTNSNAVSMMMRKMIQYPLAFSSESRRNFRIRLMALLSFVSVRSTFLSKSVRSLRNGC